WSEIVFLGAWKAMWRPKRLLWICRQGFALCVVCVLAWCGCSTPGQTAKKAPGQTRWCKAPYPRVWEAAVEAAQLSDFTLVSANKDTGEIVLRQLPNERTLGETINVRISPTGQNETMVEVQAHQVGPRTFARADSAEKVFNDIAVWLVKEPEKPTTPS